MKKVFGSVFIVLTLLSSCNLSDQPLNNNEKSKIIYTHVLSLNLEADVIEDSEENDARAISFVGREEKDNKLYPKLKISEGTKTIPVHTAIANLDGTIYGAKTVHWIYTPAKDGEPASLTFPIGEDITLSSETQFVPGNETFYVTAVVDGTLVGENIRNPKVEFSGNLDLKGIKNVGEPIPDLKAPYAIPWTKLKIHRDNILKQNVGSSRFSDPNGGENYHPKFRAQGAFIGIKINNATIGTITPEELHLRTSKFGISGAFDLRRPAVSNGQGNYPSWSFDPCAYNMDITFEGGTNAGNIAPARASDKIFYFWVMPNPNPKSDGINSAVLYAPSTDKTQSPLNSYWATSFTGVKAPKNHTAHHLEITLKQSAGVRLPIEDFTDYNLAGGDEYPNLQYKYDPNVAGATKNWVGRRGKYRLTSGDKAIHSGMYNGFMVRGERHSYFNPNGHDLERLEIKQIEEVTADGRITTKEVTPFALNTQYYIPTIQDYAGLLPSKAINWNNQSYLTQTDDKVRLGGGSNHPMIISSTSDYSPMKQNTPQGGYKRFYGLRFKESTAQLENKNCKGTEFKVRLSSAFRYTYEFVRGVSGVLRIDVVYLGDDANTLTVQKLETMPEEFWSKKNQRDDAIKGVFVRTVKFAAVGDLQSGGFDGPTNPNPFTTSHEQLSKTFSLDVGHYYARDKIGSQTAVVDWADGWEIKIATNSHHKGMPVRVFKRSE